MPNDEVVNVESHPSWPAGAAAEESQTVVAMVATENGLAADNRPAESDAPTSAVGKLRVQAQQILQLDAVTKRAIRKYLVTGRQNRLFFGPRSAQARHIGSTSGANSNMVMAAAVDGDKAAAVAKAASGATSRKCAARDRQCEGRVSQSASAVGAAARAAETTHIIQASSSSRANTAAVGTGTSHNQRFSVGTTAAPAGEGVCATKKQHQVAAAQSPVLFGSKVTSNGAEAAASSQRQPGHVSPVLSRPPSFDDGQLESDWADIVEADGRREGTSSQTISPPVSIIPHGEEGNACKRTHCTGASPAATSPSLHAATGVSPGPPPLVSPSPIHDVQLGDIMRLTNAAAETRQQDAVLVSDEDWESDNDWQDSDDDGGDELFEPNRRKRGKTGRPRRSNQVLHAGQSGHSTVSARQAADEPPPLSRVDKARLDLIEEARGSHIEAPSAANTTYMRLPAGQDAMRNVFRAAREGRAMQRGIDAGVEGTLPLYSATAAAPTIKFSQMERLNEIMPLEAARTWPKTIVGGVLQDEEIYVNGCIVDTSLQRPRANYITEPALPIHQFRASDTPLDWTFGLSVENWADQTLTPVRVWPSPPSSEAMDEFVKRDPSTRWQPPVNATGPRGLPFGQHTLGGEQFTSATDVDVDFVSVEVMTEDLQALFPNTHCYLIHSEFAELRNPQIDKSIRLAVVGQMEIFINRPPPGFRLRDFVAALNTGKVQGQPLTFETNGQMQYVQPRADFIACEKETLSYPIARRAGPLHLAILCAALKRLGVVVVSLVSAGSKSPIDPNQLLQLQQMYDRVPDFLPQLIIPQKLLIVVDLARVSYHEDVILFKMNSDQGVRDGMKMYRAETYNLFGLNGAEAEARSDGSSMVAAAYGIVKVSNRRLTKDKLLEYYQTQPRHGADFEVVDAKIYLPAVHSYKSFFNIMRDDVKTARAINYRLDILKEVMAKLPNVLHQTAHRCEFRFKTKTLRKLPVNVLTVRYLAAALGVTCYVRDLISPQCVLDSAFAVLNQLEREGGFQPAVRTFKTTLPENVKQHMLANVARAQQAAGFNPGNQALRKQHNVGELAKQAGISKTFAAKELAAQICSAHTPYECIGGRWKIAEDAGLARRTTSEDFADFVNSVAIRNGKKGTFAAMKISGAPLKFVQSPRLAIEQAGCFVLSQCTDQARCGIRCYKNYVKVLKPNRAPTNAGHSIASRLVKEDAASTVETTTWTVPADLRKSLQQLRGKDHFADFVQHAVTRPHPRAQQEHCLGFRRKGVSKSAPTIIGALCKAALWLIKKCKKDQCTLECWRERFIGSETVLPGRTELLANCAALITDACNPTHDVGKGPARASRASTVGNGRRTTTDVASAADGAGRDEVVFSQQVMRVIRSDNMSAAAAPSLPPNLPPERMQKEWQDVQSLLLDCPSEVLQCVGCEPQQDAVLKHPVQPDGAGFLAETVVQAVLNLLVKATPLPYGFSAVTDCLTVRLAYAKYAPLPAAKVPGMTLLWVNNPKHFVVVFAVGSPHQPELLFYDPLGARHGAKLFRRYEIQRVLVQMYAPRYLHFYEPDPAVQHMNVVFADGFRQPTSYSCGDSCIVAVAAVLDLLRLLAARDTHVGGCCVSALDLAHHLKRVQFSDVTGFRNLLNHAAKRPEHRFGIGDVIGEGRPAVYTKYEIFVENPVRGRLVPGAYLVDFFEASVRTVLMKNRGITSDAQQALRSWLEISDTVRWLEACSTGAEQQFLVWHKNYQLQEGRWQDLKDSRLNRHSGEDILMPRKLTAAVGKKISWRGMTAYEMVKIAAEKELQQQYVSERAAATKAFYGATTRRTMRVIADDGNASVSLLRKYEQSQAQRQQELDEWSSSKRRAGLPTIGLGVLTAKRTAAKNADGPSTEVVVYGVPVGIVNFGNSCYLNSTMQALASCPTFIRYIEFLAEQQSRSSAVVGPLGEILTATVAGVGDVTEMAQVLLRLAAAEMSDGDPNQQHDVHEYFSSLVRGGGGEGDWRLFGC